MIDKEIRRGRLQRLAKSIIDSTRTTEALLKRVVELEGFELEFKRFYRKSDYNHEDDALDAFIKNNSPKRVSGIKVKDKRHKKILESDFISFALLFLDNLNGIKLDRDQNGEIAGLEPLSFSELWEALNIFGRVKIKRKVVIRKNNVPEDLWKKAKRKDGHTKPLGKVLPCELLGVKSWSPAVEKKMLEHKSLFRFLLIGYFSGHRKFGLEIEEKCSDMLAGKHLRKYLDSRFNDQNVPDCRVDLSVPDEPKFEGISLPKAVLARIAMDEDKSIGKAYLDQIEKRPPSGKSK